jgi:hypothetical protein
MEVVITTADEVQRLRREWHVAAEAWTVARGNGAECSPAVDAALDACSRAKRAYDDAWLAHWAQQQGVS